MDTVYDQNGSSIGNIPDVSGQTSNQYTPTDVQTAFGTPPATGSQSETAAPLAALEATNNPAAPYTTGSYQYPKNIETLAHAMVFYINVNENSADAVKSNQEENKTSDVNVLRRQSIRSAGQYSNGGTIDTIARAVNSLTKNAADTSIISLIRQRKTKRIKTTITIYMPETLNFDYNQHYDDIKLGDELLKGTTGIVGALGNVLAGKFPLTGTIFKDASKAVGSFSGGIGNRIAQLGFGATFNPVVEVLYSAPTLRKFNFTFNFSPRSEDESLEVMNIIREFRRHQAPEYTLGGMFFLSPSEFDIQFMRNVGGQFVQNGMLPKMTTAVLEDVQINYAPDGQFVTFPNGLPVHIQLNMSFKEVDIITRDRVDQGY